MSIAPADMLAARDDWLWITGLAGNALGIAADPSHLGSGGYHCGGLDLKRINAVANDDYSIRQPRDRAYYTFEVAHGSNLASATDIGSTWARGGRSAWLRFCALLRLQLGARDPLLSAVRGINYTNAAGAVRRFDCLTHTESSSSDRDHTHVEFWRDTVGTAERGRALGRITDIMIAARDSTALKDPPRPPAAKPSLKIGDEMIYNVTSVPAGTVDAGGNAVPENGKCIATPNGPFGYTGTEWFSMGPGEADWPPVITMTWARLQTLCELMNPAAANPNA
jgi:hypothetical protein